MQVVYYGNYLTYFEVGRVEFLRQQGLPMSDVDQKVHLPVVEAVVRYVRPARLDDLLEVRCWVSERKRASFRCLDPATSKMIAMPPWLRELMPVVQSEPKPSV